MTFLRGLNLAEARQKGVPEKLGGKAFEQAGGKTYTGNFLEGMRGGGEEMSRIGVILTDTFEDLEYSEPVEALREAGHEMVHVGVGLEEGQTAQGKSKGTQIRIDKAVKDASVDKFDALLIPRGTPPQKFRRHGEAVRFVKEFMEKGKPVLTSRRKSPS